MKFRSFSYRSALCGTLQPSAEMCGESREAAMIWLGELDQATRPPL